MFQKQFQVTLKEIHSTVKENKFYKVRIIGQTQDKAKDKNQLTVKNGRMDTAVAGGRGKGGGMAWEIGMDVYTLLYIK